MKINWISVTLAGLIAALSATLAVQAQVPGVGNTLASVFTLAYDNSTSKPTYSSTVVFTPPASADTVCTIQGSATKTIRLRRILIWGTTATATTDPAAITFRNSAITTSGTSVIAVVGKYAANAANATAVVEYYTAAPTENAIASELLDIPVFFGAIGSATSTPTPYEVRFGDLASPVFLRGTSQIVTVGLNHITLAQSAATPAGQPQMSCTWEWTEDNDS